MTSLSLKKTPFCRDTMSRIGREQLRTLAVLLQPKSQRSQSAMAIRRERAARPQAKYVRSSYQWRRKQPGRETTGRQCPHTGERSVRCTTPSKPPSPQESQIFFFLKKRAGLIIVTRVATCLSHHPQRGTPESSLLVPTPGGDPQILNPWTQPRRTRNDAVE